MCRTGRCARERWQNQRDGERKEQKMRRSQEKPGKKARRLHWEKQACRGEGTPWQPRLCEAVAKPSEAAKLAGMRDLLDRDMASRWSTRRASPAALPTRGERALAAHGKGSLPFAWRSCGARWQAHLDALVSHELPAGAPIVLSHSGAGPPRRGCSRTRMRRGFVVASPCH